ncbi:MAG: cupin domain-containing protein [Pedobacter sp.]|nr:MAG: cupin domain-containing protein [Pedobacter sp.]
MNLRAYIDSGVLELYAINSLSEQESKDVEAMLARFPELRKELLSIENALESYAKSRWIAPPSHLEDIVVSSLLNLEKEKAMDLTNLPLINRFSDYKNWLPLVQSFGNLSIGEDGRFVKVLRHDDRVTQMLIVSTTDIEEEVHDDEHESFLILSGDCRCTIGNNERLMKAGDFMDIPLYEEHDVKLVSETVMAILQRVKI